MARDADLVLVDGKLFTAVPDRPWARALAVRDDRLIAVGTNTQVERYVGRATKRVDLHGRVVVPGFIDAHAHLADSAGERGRIRLAGTRTIEDAVARLRKAATSTPRGGWILGIDWDEAKWPERRFLTREDLDRVSTDHFVVARRIDCHIGSLNSKALELAADLVGARGFDVDGSGRPTGILKEDAFGAFHRRFETGETGIEAGLASVAKMAHRLGITSIHDIVDRSGWKAYQRAHDRRALGVRVYAMLRDSLMPALIEAGQDAEPRKDARHRIEHYELPDDEVLRRTKTARIVASCQPNFIGQWSGPGDVYETRLGVARAAKNNPYRKILRRRIPLCFGSDGMPYGPLYGVHWAVNGFVEDQRISPEEAVRAATAGSAFAAFEEDDKGTLEPGKLADFVILDGDPFETPEAIARMRVASTWIGGRRVYAPSPKS